MRAVVVGGGVSMDTLLVWGLNTYGHPLWTWSFNMFAYSATGRSVYLKVAFAVTAVHVLCHLNWRYKTRGPMAAGPKVILVTGGSRGLGARIVEHSLQRLDVAKVIVLDVVEPQIADARVVFYRCDVSDGAQLQKVIEDVKQAYTVTTLVNNAGTRHSESLAHLESSAIDHIFRVNTMSAVHLLRAFTREAQELHVITVASVLGTIAPKNLSVYAASKAALVQIHESLSYELDTSRFRFSLFLPGQLNTAMFANVKVPNTFLAPVVDVDKLGRRIVDCIATGERGVFCDPVYANFIPLLRLLPFSVYEWVRSYSQIDRQIGVQGDGDEFVIIN